MADPTIGGGGGEELPPADAFPPPGQGFGPTLNPLETLPMSNVTGFCTINERGIGWATD